MRLHTGQVIETLVKQADGVGAEGRIALANAATAIVEMGQREELLALERKLEREKAHYDQWIAQSFGHLPAGLHGPEGRKIRSAVMVPGLNGNG